MRYEIDRLPELISRYFHNERPFSLVRFPGENNVYENIGLRIIPFNSKWADGFSLSSEGKNNEQFYTSTKKEDYLNKIAELIEDLNQSGNKVVISALIDGRLTDEQRSCLPENIKNLFKANPNCFAAVFRAERAGLWIVITPEILLREKYGELSTMALAGTRPYGTIQPWDSKNLIEQQFVTNYIKQCWEDVGLTVNLSPQKTLQAGPVEHICTDISSKASTPDDFVRLINLMNPTPAVCGTPKRYALDKIVELEKHQRQLYSGAICAEREDGEKIAFVTLRCIHLSQNGRYNIYVGGGITANSTPESEWEETRLKASQLLNCLTLEKIPENGKK